MNRRKSISRILVIIGGSIAAYSGFKIWDLEKQPDFEFLEKQRDTIASLAETIIPATDSPGAKDAGVQDFIIMMIKECTERKTQNKFIDGLKELKKFSSSHYHKNFTQCSQKEQSEILSRFETKGKSYPGLVGKEEDKLFGKSFFDTLKSLTVEGYCTSELGATKGLSYQLIPGKFIGCIPLQPGQKAWATH